MYWLKYAAFALAGVPVAWVIERGVPNDLPGSVRGWLEVPTSTAVPTLLLLLCACVSRGADAGSTAVALRNQGLVEGATSLGRSPDYALLYKLALYQSIVLTILVLAGAAGLSVHSRFVLGLVLFVSTCAATQNLLLYLGHSSLPHPPLRRTHALSQHDVLAHNADVWLYKLLAGMLQIVAALAAILVASLFCLSMFRFGWPVRAGLVAAFLAGSGYLMLLGLVEGQTRREEVAAAREADDLIWQRLHFEEMKLRLHSPEDMFVSLARDRLSDVDRDVLRKFVREGRLDRYVWERIFPHEFP